MLNNWEVVAGALLLQHTHSVRVNWEVLFPTRNSRRLRKASSTQQTPKTPDSMEKKSEVTKMEAEKRRVLRSNSRKPLSDCTNTTTRPSSQSSSSTPSVFKPPMPTKFLTTVKPPARTTSSNNSTNYNTASNPSSSTLSTPKKSFSVAVSGTSDDVFKSTTVYSRRQALDKRKRRGKEVAVPFISTPMPKTLNSGLKSGEVERVDLPKSLTVPRRKKQRTRSSEKDLSKNSSLQDFIKKQQAYFKEIDAFELPEEEVGSAEELE